MSKTEPLGSLPTSMPTEGMAAVTELVAGYRLLEPLGEGGMASVYLAEHTETGQRVALKRIKDQAKSDPQFKERFLREVRAAARLDHKNICRVFAGGEDGASVYMACELLSGGDINALLSRLGGKVPAAVACIVIAELLEALDHAHQAGLVHRDIKPANVMLDAQGVTKLVDFGIAKANDDQKLTATGLVIGTPAYMSPEQARGLPLDARSDLFSVGAMLVELLTGSNPFSAESATATVMRILLEAAPPLFSLDPTAPGVLQHVAAGLLEREPLRRYPSARAALDDLAPYRALVQQAHPDLLARCLANPEATQRELLAEQARFECDRAADLIDNGVDGEAAAALALFRATRLDPASTDARERFSAVCRNGGFNFTPDDKRVADVERQNADQPHTPMLMKRAADVHAAVKNPLGQALWLSRYLQAQPSDELARRQWHALTSGPPPRAGNTRVQLSTREIVDGIKTGGWKHANRATEQMSAARPATRPPQPAPVRSAQTDPPTAVTGPTVAPIVVVAERAPQSALPWLGGAAALAVILVGGGALVSGARNTVRGAQQEFQAAATAANTEQAERDAVVRALAQAEQHLLDRAPNDALVHADVALRLSPTGNEAATAYFIKARARLIDGDKLGAEREFKQYFDVAPPSHPRYQEAKSSYEALTRSTRPGPPPGLGVTPTPTER